MIKGAKINQLYCYKYKFSIFISYVDEKNHTHIRNLCAPRTAHHHDSSMSTGGASSTSEIIDRDRELYLYMCTCICVCTCLFMCTWAHTKATVRTCEDNGATGENAVAHAYTSYYKSPRASALYLYQYRIFFFTSVVACTILIVNLCLTSRILSNPVA